MSTMILSPDSYKYSVSWSPFSTMYAASSSSVCIVANKFLCLYDPESTSSPARIAVYNLETKTQVGTWTISNISSLSKNAAYAMIGLQNEIVMIGTYDTASAGVVRIPVNQDGQLGTAVEVVPNSGIPSALDTPVTYAMVAAYRDDTSIWVISKSSGNYGVFNLNTNTFSDIKPFGWSQPNDGWGAEHTFAYRDVSSGKLVISFWDNDGLHYMHALNEDMSIAYSQINRSAGTGMQSSEFKKMFPNSINIAFGVRNTWIATGPFSTYAAVLVDRTLYVWDNIEPYGVGNNPPTQPGVITGIEEGSVYLNGEMININWGASSDSDGDVIGYDIEFTIDGSSWNSLATGVAETTRNYEITGAESDVVQFRIRAKDPKGGYSPFVYSPKFKTRKKLILIQDGDVIKTFKNGNWQAI